MKYEIDACKEKQELIVAWENKQLNITHDQYLEKLNCLNEKIKQKLDTILNVEIKEKIETIKAQPITTKSSYKNYKEVLQLYRDS